MKKINEKRNFFNFIFYTFTVIIISSLLISKITIKNELLKTQREIEKLNNIFIANSDIVKELQSSRNYLTSYDYIENYLSEKMVAAIPETL